MSLMLERAAPAGAIAEPLPPRRRRLRRLVLAAGVVAVLAWAGVSAVTLVRAVHAMQRGVTAVDDVRHQLGPEDLSADVPSGRLATAETSFRQAHQLLDRPYVAPLRLVPFVGRQLRSVTELAGAATQVTHIGAGSLRDVHATLQAHHHTGPDRLAVLHRLAVIAGTSNTQLRAVRLGPSQGLVKSLVTKRAGFAGDLTKVQDGLAQAQAATAALTDLLGNSRPYLLLAANNAEMRAGSGMFLDAGVLVPTGDGHFSLSSVASTGDLQLPPPGVALSGDLGARWGFLQPNRTWQNLALSPQFAANAELAARMWQAKTGQQVAGVLAVDVSALREVLGVTGPVGSGSGITVDAASVEKYLLHDQYVTTGSDTWSIEAARREGLGVLARSVFEQVNTSDVSLVHLGPALARAASGRHILAWASDPAIEKDWEVAGVAGNLGPDDLLLSVLNRGANKIDPFLSVQAHLQLKPAAVTGSDTTDASVQVTVRNGTPPGQPPYVVGHGGTAPGAGPGDYVGIIALDLPGRAGDVTMDGSLPAVAAGSDGPSIVLATPVTIKQGQTLTVTFRFRLAGRHGQLRIAPSARLPATAWQDGPANFQDSTSHLVDW
ncbi:MAG TPA: DUF4012 domain-containing protein [Acidimicrobiales bacterium]|nr:DUF4012 domain-containing protein [Acidimicrobiales bacterium]